MVEELTLIQKDHDNILSVLTLLAYAQN